MKKLIGTVMVAALVASAAFAEITFGAWLRALGAPVASDGVNTVAAMGNSWGYGTRTARLNVNATADDGNVGFSMGIYNDANMSLSAGDDARIWAKPAEMVTVSLGKYDNNTLRGDMAYGSWNWFRPTSCWIQDDEGLLMSGNGGTGMLFELTPVEGLYVQAMIPMASTKQNAEDVYKNIRGGFAYNIEGVGKLKAQFIGSGVPKKAASGAVTAGWVYTAAGATDAGGSTKAGDAVGSFDAEKWAKGFMTYNAAAAATPEESARWDKTLEAEFDLTSVENLWLGVGFQMKLYDDADKTEIAVFKDANTDAQKIAAANNFTKMRISLGASYQVSEELKVSASGAYFIYEKSGDKGMDPRFQAGAGVDYNLGDGLALSADVRYLSKAKAYGASVDCSDRVGFGVGVTKSISSNGYIGAAFQGQTNSGTWANNVIEAATKDKDGKDLEKLNKFTWCVPVAISCWF